MIVKKRDWFSIVCIGVAIILFYRSCIPHKVNEEVFYEGNNIRLKVVRYFENIPLHFTGIVHTIRCKPKGKFGWIEIPNSPDIGVLGWEPKLDVIVAAAKKAYFVTDMDTMIFRTHGSGIRVTWDACVKFRKWSPNRLPDDIVDSKGYFTCLEKSKKKEEEGALISGWGKANCRSHRFLDDNTPTFSNLTARKNGAASFEVYSKAFLDSEGFLVKTDSYGEVWEIEPISDK